LSVEVLGRFLHLLYYYWRGHFLALERFFFHLGHVAMLGV